jgi:hypothetical protein
MTTTLVNLAFLASAMAYAAVLSKGIPEPTPFVPATSVQGPVPTAVAQLSFDLFKRKGDENDYTCGFVSGSSGKSDPLHPKPFQVIPTYSLSVS